MGLVNQETQEFLKNKSKKEKIGYYWYYYKWHIIVAAVAIIVLAIVGYRFCTKKEVVLSGVFVNGGVYVDEAREDMIRDFAEKQGMDSEKEEIDISAILVYSPGDSVGPGTNNMNTLNALQTWIYSGTVDFVAGDLESLTELAYNGLFCNLEEVFTEEELALCESQLCYIDGAVIRMIDENIEAKENVKKIVYPDPTKPELMEEPIPVFIEMSDSEKLREQFSHPFDNLVFAYAIQHPNFDNAKVFMDYLMD